MGCLNVSCNSQFYSVPQTICTLRVKNCHKIILRVYMNYKIREASV